MNPNSRTLLFACAVPALPGLATQSVLAGDNQLPAG